MARPRLTAQQVAEIIDAPFETTANRCHEVSLAIVRSGLVGPARVARGFCKGVPSQHSWVVCGTDCYAARARIIDATLWSYGSTVEGVWCGSAADGRHVPHGGIGTIWSYGRPAEPTQEPIVLTPAMPLSAAAQVFLDMVGPLDHAGWMQLANAPVAGWPAAEIIAAMDDTDTLSALVPIDRLGMLTDRNPGGLYL